MNTAARRPARYLSSVIRRSTWRGTREAKPIIIYLSVLVKRPTFVLCTGPTTLCARVLCVATHTHTRGKFPSSISLLSLPSRALSSPFVLMHAHLKNRCRRRLFCLLALLSHSRSLLLFCFPALPRCRPSSDSRQDPPTHTTRARDAFVRQDRTRWFENARWLPSGCSPSSKKNGCGARAAHKT